MLEEKPNVRGVNFYINESSARIKNHIVTRVTNERTTLLFVLI